MIDFKEIPADGTLFEQFVREMLLASGFSPHWTGQGPDHGRDLIIQEQAIGSLSTFGRKWLVQCKHHAHSEKSVGRNDVNGFLDDCRQIGADGYLLVTSTQPSASLVTKLEEIADNSESRITIKIWDSVELEKRMQEPRCFALGHIFFPKSFSVIPWKIYNRGEPNKWTAHYKDYFILLTSRIGGQHPYLGDCEAIIKKIEAITGLGENEYLRPRSIYYDDKHDDYTVSLDYLYPRGSEPTFDNNFFNKSFNNGMGLYHDDQWMWKITTWDVEFREILPHSDHFDIDHYDYYGEGLGSFESGLMRAPFWKRTLNTEGMRIVKIPLNKS